MGIADIFETIMILSFGVSWPINVTKSIRSRTAKGKSVMFNYLILFGYFCGVIAKTIAHNYNLAFYFYFPNIIMVMIDIAIYYRNRRLDAACAEEIQK